MQIAILVALIGALATLIAGIITNSLQRRREHDLRNLEFKVSRYVDFLGAFGEIGSGRKSCEAHLRIANTVNSMNLIASRSVLQEVYSLFDYIGSNREASYSVVEQVAIIRRIIQAIRKDLGQSDSDLKDFPFRTFSPGIKPGENVEN